MEKKYLIVDKKQRVDIEGQYPYAINRIFEELEKAGIPYDFAYNTQISIEVIDGQMQIHVNEHDITEYSHILLRGHFSRRDYEIKNIIVKYIDNYNSQNPDKQILIQNANFIKKLPHYSKMYQALICAENGIPYLNTYYKTDGSYKDNTGSIAFPKILKHYTGKNYLTTIDGKLTQKKNVFLVDSTASFSTGLLAQRNLQNYFVQEFVATGEDIRLYVQKNSVIGAWKRKATEGFLTVGKNSVYETYEPTPELIDLAQKTASVFTNDFMAIDIIFKDEKPYILEVNMNPGFKAYETKVEGTHANIAKAIIESF